MYAGPFRRASPDQELTKKWVGRSEYIYPPSVYYLYVGLQTVLGKEHEKTMHKFRTLISNDKISSYYFLFLHLATTTSNTRLVG